ncbi:FHA domain-containing protein [Agromyces arachidis]|uniref:FHA domain-containing protein n=1 Tax=Agromyces arachidis TaxID=766966 RepID=UPI004057C52F
MSDFIVPPPGLVPDAPQPAEPERTIRVPDRRPAFHPAPAPPAPAAPESAGAAAVPRPGPRTAWRLRSDDGTDVLVSGRVVLGRDPQATEAASGARPVALEDPARSVSKTHALLDVVEDRLLATDLASTNGVRIWAEGEQPVELEPGRPTSVPEGAVLLLGDVAFLVGRASDATV